MTDLPQDCALRPMAKRLRKHNRRSLRDKAGKSRDQPGRNASGEAVAAEETSAKVARGEHCSIGVRLLSGPAVRSFARETSGGGGGGGELVRGFSSKKEEILAEVQSWVSRQRQAERPNPWVSNLEPAEAYRLLTSSDPVRQLRDQTLSLPHFLSKMFRKTSVDVAPSIYGRDQTWLTLQWTVDGVENPFGSRPCASLPCLGSSIAREPPTPQEEEAFPLPELVPLATLEQYRWHRATGGSTSDWPSLMKEKRRVPALAITTYPLARDLWSQPKCLLCRLHQMFVFAVDPASSRKTTRLADYQRCYSLQLEALHPDLYVDPGEMNMEWIMEESGVLLPHLKVPLVGRLVSLLKRTQSGGIVTDDWYALE